MRKTILLIGLVISLGGISWFLYSSRHPKNLQYEDLSKTNPYETMARQTGGQVLHFDKNNMEEATKALTAGAKQALEESRDYMMLWTSEGRATGHDTQINFDVSPEITTVSVFASGVKSRPEVKVFGPSGEDLKADEVVESQQAQTLIFKSPRPGHWKTKVVSSDNISIQIKAKGLTWFREPEPVRLAGRAGHEGYFPYKGALKPGTKEKFSVEWPSSWKIKEAWLSPVSLDGRILSKTKWDGEVMIPGEEFRILLKWEDDSGQFGQRMGPYSFQLNTLELIEFQTRAEEQANSQKCKTLEVASHWSVLTDPKTNASAHLSCVKENFNGKEKWISVFAMRVPWNPSEKITTTKLYSADYRKLSKSDCDQAQGLFSSYGKLNRESAPQDAEITFECVPSGNEFHGTLTVQVKKLEQQ